ncbi:hypothetical protein D9M71_587580 [compost metagenome]
MGQEHPGRTQRLPDQPGEQLQVAEQPGQVHQAGGRAALLAQGVHAKGGDPALYFQAQLSGAGMQHAAELRGTADGFAEGAAAEQAAAHQVDFVLAHRRLALALRDLCLQLLDGLSVQRHEAVRRDWRMRLVLSGGRQAVALQLLQEPSIQPVGNANAMR